MPQRVRLNEIGGLSRKNVDIMEKNRLEWGYVMGYGRLIL